jgi:hypothetical protein
LVPTRAPAREQHQRDKMEAAWGEALITLHVPAGKRKEGGCIALRVPDEVLTLGKTQAAVANGIHRTMNRRKKNIDKFLANLLDLSSFSQPWG